MKKIFAMVVAIFVSMSMFAQGEVGSFYISPKVGVNIATLTTPDNARMRLGLALGGEVGYQMTEKFAVTAGVMYSHQGAKQVQAETLKMNYLTMPVMVDYYLLKGLAVKAGVQPGLLVFTSCAARDTHDVYNKVDVSIPMGLSYEYRNVMLDARYHLDLLKVNKRGSFSSRNSLVQVTVGYKFNLK